MRVRVAACAAMTAAAIAAPAASAATLTVNSTFDETNAFDGSCSLREAILAVDSPGSASGDCSAAAFGANTIVLKPGRYFLGSSSAPHTPLQIASTVTSLTIAGAGESQTAIDAVSLGNRVFEVAPGATMTIRDLEIAGGHAPDGASGPAGGAGAGGQNGGAILNQGTLSLLDMMIDNSQAGAGGAGGAAGGAPSDPASSGGHGGAGGEGGGIFNTGALTLTGATIARTSSGAGGSGGIGGQESTTNPGGSGGAGGAGGNGAGLANEGGTVTITGSAIRGNTGGAAGAGGAGGGSNNGGSGTGGTGGIGGAGTSGGGVWSAGGSLSITNSTIASNTTGDGGGGGNGGTGVGAGSTGGNGANGGDSGSGGGVAVSGSPSPQLVNVTVVGNRVGQPGSPGSGGTGVAASGAAGNAGTAGAGGGLAGVAAGVLSVENSLLALNGGSNCAPSAVTDGGHNLSFGDGTCPGSFATGDPNLGPLQDNGGASWTVSLLAGSAAIDQIPATGAGCPATDQRGVARPAGPKCDIGAYEAAGPKATTNAATAVGRTNATLNGAVTPNSGLASVHFTYGTTTKYGSSTSARLLTGVVPIAVKATVGRLRSGVTYHYRLVATTSDGTVQGADRTFTTTIAPKLSRLTLRSHRFKAGRGTTIGYIDTKAARTNFVVLRLVRHRKPHRVARFSHRDKAGRNSVRFAGRGLKPGNYRLQATPGLRGLTGATVSVTFTIRK
jgi:CSLREA domain-containing protein